MLMPTLIINKEGHVGVGANPNYKQGHVGVNKQGHVGVNADPNYKQGRPRCQP